MEKRRKLMDAWAAYCAKREMAAREQDGADQGIERLIDEQNCTIFGAFCVRPLSFINADADGSYHVRTTRYTRQWLRPTKLREYCGSDQFVPDVRDAEYQLYWAVVDGNIRARHGGRLLTPEEAHALREKSWSSVEGDLYALPSDLELSVKDAKHIWREVARAARR